MISTEKEVVLYSGFEMIDLKADMIWWFVEMRAGPWLSKFGRGNAGDGASQED